MESPDSQDPPSSTSRDPNHLPGFAEQWAAQWKAAAPKLQEIRDHELRALNTKPKPKMISHAEARNHGMAIMQTKFMRIHILQLQEEVKQLKRQLAAAEAKRE